MLFLGRSIHFASCMGTSIRQNAFFQSWWFTQVQDRCCKDLWEVATRQRQAVCSEKGLQGTRYTPGHMLSGYKSRPILHILHCLLSLGWGTLNYNPRTTCVLPILFHTYFLAKKICNLETKPSLPNRGPNFQQRIGNQAVNSSSMKNTAPARLRLPNQQNAEIYSTPLLQITVSELWLPSSERKTKREKGDTTALLMPQVKQLSSQLRRNQKRGLIHY